MAAVKERGTIGWVALPRHKLGLGKPQLVQLGRGACLKDSKYSVTPGNVTDGVFRLHQADLCYI